jgi:urease accessory protein
MSLEARWLVLQLSDSGFPSGSFAHSGGLESACHAGLVATVADLDRYVASHLWNLGHAALPFAGAAFDEPDEVWTLDRLLDVRVTNHVANRASRTQGRAFVATCARVFDEPRVTEMARRARGLEVPAHLAPLFGAVLAVLGVGRDQALDLLLFSSARSVVSAAVRLGIVGPYQGQRTLSRCIPVAVRVLTRCRRLRPEDAATVSPLLDVVGATHDRLYARLFQS